MGWVTIIPRIRKDMEMSTPSRPPWIPKKYLDQSEREKGALWLLESISMYFLGFKRVGFFLHFFPQSRHPNRQIISYWYLNCHRKSLLQSLNRGCWHSVFFESVLKWRKRSLKKCILSKNGQTRERGRVICTYMREKFAITLQESLSKFGFLTYYGAFHLYSVNQLCRLGWFN